METILTSMLSLNTVVGLIAGAAATFLAKWIASEKGAKYKAFEGYAISAVRLAEKAIPDDTLDAGAMKLDYALKTFLAKYRKATGVEPNEAAVAKIEAWISTIHNTLDAAGVLGTKLRAATIEQASTTRKEGAQ